jgi:hypothetical protein
MSLLDVPKEKLQRVSELISLLEGGSTADALMSLVVAYQQRGVEITHLKGKFSRQLEDLQRKSP